MRFWLEFNMDNDEFRHPTGAAKAAVVRAMMETVGKVKLVPHGDIARPKVGTGGKIMDLNGNTIGSWGISK